MVVVEEDREHPYIVALRLLLVDGIAADRNGRPLGSVRVDGDELEGVDLLALAAFRDVEVVRGEIGNLAAIPGGRDDVDADNVNPGAECRSIGGWRRRGILACSPVPAQGQDRDEAGEGTTRNVPAMGSS